MLDERYEAIVKQYPVDTSAETIEKMNKVAKRPLPQEIVSKKLKDNRNPLPEELKSLEYKPSIHCCSHCFCFEAKCQWAFGFKTKAVRTTVDT